MPPRKSRSNSGQPPSNNATGQLSLDPNLEDLGVGIEPIEIQAEMERSFLEYSMAVIVSRALPDVRDGLKPVHRRILYAMYDMGLRPDRPHTKCAKVVGEVMGNFHPHGDQAIYDALVRMVQDFSLRYPLIDGHGNFGSPDPDTGAAAQRYTECRLAPLALQLMAGIDEDTVDFMSSYDGSREEPVVLPGRFPNLLVNGAQGIAVGMATNIPPHNMDEIITAALYVIDHPEASPDDLMKFVSGPDFPTGALILGRSGILDAYRTGKGSIRMRAVAEIEEGHGSTKIVVTEIPYQTSVEAIERKIGELADSKDLEGISSIQNDSAGRKTRLVITLKRTANANVVLNNLYKYTPMQSSFGVNMVALVDGVPRTLNLAQMLYYFVEHQVEVVKRRSEFRLAKAKARAHIVEGLLKAIGVLDAVIELIRGSDDRDSARRGLMDVPFSFTEIQANHILDLTLGRLTRLGRSELEEEMTKLRETIAQLDAILSDRGTLHTVIKEELGEVRKLYAQPRRSKVVLDPGDIAIEDLIEDEELVVTMTRAGYVKTVATAAFRTQGRGGRGVQGARLKEEDLVAHLAYATAHSLILFFSNKGKVYRLKAHEIPMRDRNAKGTAIVNLIPLAPGEVIQTMIVTREMPQDEFLVFATKFGHIKKTALSEYDKSRREGFIAVALKGKDELVRVIRTSGEQDLLMVSRGGMAIRFNETQVRPTARDTGGVKGMKLKTGDEVVSCDAIATDSDLLLVTDSGYGKRTKAAQFNVQARGGQGVRAITLSEKRGFVVAAFMTSINDEIILISSGGVTIRTAVREIASQGRSATGVRVMNLDAGQNVAAATPVMGADDQ